MSRLTQPGQGGPLELFATSNDSSLATITGAKFYAADGREFVIVQNGGTALASGNLIQGPVAIGANHTGLTLSTAAIGATQITATLGGTAVTANQYAGGYLVVSAGTGIGQTLKIASHPAQATTSGTVVLTLEDALTVATATVDSKGTLMLNPFGSSKGAAFATSGVVVTPAGTLTGPVIGVSLYPIAATSTTVLSYGLIQTKGVIACLNQGATAVGLDLMPSASVAGAVCTYVVATKTRVGTASVAGEDGKAQMITIQL